jgi:hypothetical protein
MRAFVFACIGAIIIAIIGAVVLGSIQESADQAFSTSAVPDPQIRRLLRVFVSKGIFFAKNSFVAD